jgi:hypothetical protein
MSIYKTSVLILVILILSLFIGCDNFKSKELSSEKKLELAEKCSKAGKEYFRDFTKDTPIKGYLWDQPEYHYSNRLNTCLIHIKYVQLDETGTSGLSFHFNQVVDVFSNKTILYGWFDKNDETKIETLLEPPNKDVPNYNSSRYVEEKNKLFSE